MVQTLHEALQHRKHILPSRQPLSQIKQGPSRPKVAEETYFASPGTPYNNSWDGCLPPASLASSTETAKFC